MRCASCLTFPWPHAQVYKGPQDLEWHVVSLGTGAGTGICPYVLRLQIKLSFDWAVAFPKGGGRDYYFTCFQVTHRSIVIVGRAFCNLQLRVVSNLHVDVLRIDVDEVDCSLHAAPADRLGTYSL